MKIPQIITAGDSVNWTEEIVCLPGLSYKVVLVAQGKAPVEIAGTVADDQLTFLTFQITKTASAALSVGDYCAYLIAYDETNRETLDHCNVTVKPDPLSTSGADTRSRVKRILDDIDAVIEERASDAVMDRSVDGMTFRYISLEKLLELRDKYALLYHQEQGGIIDLPGSVNLSLRSPYER